MHPDMFQSVFSLALRGAGGVHVLCKVAPFQSMKNGIADSLPGECGGSGNEAVHNWMTYHVGAI